MREQKVRYKQIYIKGLVMKLCQKIIEYYKYRKNNEQEKEIKTTERHTKPATNSLLAIGGKR